MKLLPWNDGHEHLWTYFGGMATCQKCAAEGLPGNRVKAPTRRSREHHRIGAEARPVDLQDRVLRLAQSACGASVKVKFEPRDLWVGLFWDRRADGLHLFVCPVPCVVFHWVMP